MDTEKRLVIARGRYWGWAGEIREINEGSPKMNKLWAVMYSLVTIVNKTAMYIWKLLRDLTSSHYKKKIDNYVW